MLNYRLKNYLFPLVLLFISTSVFSQRKAPKPIITSVNKKAGVFIDVNAAGYVPSTYSAEQLVKDVLINGGSTCSIPNVSNVTVTPNQPTTNNDRFWGYFHKGTTNFPFKDGIVLTTGYARQAGNVAATPSIPVTGAGINDPDLVAAVPITNPADNYNDNVMLEFDFVPNSNQVKFNYLFASEEYTGSFPCQYSDAFALLIKPVSGGPYVNVAVLPGAAGPVSMTNIHPVVTGSLGCPAINEQYFSGYNPAPKVVTNYNGRTVPLTAIADVTPGVAYHFKMVLSDYRDMYYDSAVFIEGGSFDIGIKLVDGSGVLLPSELKVCDNIPQTLVAQVSGITGATYQWYKDGVAIPGATSATYIATSPGVYTIKVMVPGNTCPAEATVKIIGGTTPVAQNAILKLCTTPTVSTFNLNTAKPLISTTTGAVFSFYPTQAGAQAQDNTFIPTASLASYNGTDGQVLYVLVSNGAFCSKVVTLTLQKEATPIAALIASKLKICKGESVTLTASGGVTYEWNVLSGTAALQTVTPNQTTTYTVYAIGAQGCKSLQPATVTVEVVPAITSNLKGGMICVGDKIILDAGSGPNYTYTWSTGATTQTIQVGTPGAYSVTINNGVCTKIYTTQVIQAIIPEIINVNYNENGTMMITASNPSNGPLEYSTDNGLTWQNSNTFTNIPRNVVVQIRVRVKNTSCVGFLEYFTFVMQNVITPNGDNINDKIDFSGLMTYKDFKASVFDRYGREVYKAEKIRPYWDGFFQGKRLPTASYWYQLNFDDPASKKPTVKTGWILLKNFE
ncbi:choice-of-anchor L domain-containing protein [Chryseobacterium polytrichastri]|uniref:Gliding motility-associated C-terminal domain-containing protein n=1 Tax=Chryseobacterium polytrichastri TaxID=1302687 RepID=A0A1M7HTS4_9FLAO|nr:choice-of-anchor L domain-containing protein [Chryseobacterium polytrichastri]SHM31884.1 gliding motility-associated C-terminal domain-containing protein [Chryseobacterium polytrichastri]